MKVTLDHVFVRRSTTAGQRSDIAIGVGSREFDSRTGQIGDNVAIAGVFLRSCVA